MRSFVVLAFGALIVASLDMLLGIKIEPAWKKILHAILYMAWGGFTFWAISSEE